MIKECPNPGTNTPRHRSDTEARGNNAGAPSAHSCSHISASQCFIPFLALSLMLLVPRLEAVETVTFLKDINAVEMPDGNPWLCEMGGILYFANGRPTEGIELWKTDGTPSGTSVIKDINPGSSSSSPASLVKMGAHFYFAATDPGHGRELWRSDGTSSGTELVKDAAPGPVLSSPECLTPMASTLYFVANGVHGKALWKSDGTTSGTQCVLDINPSSSYETFEQLTPVGSTLFFVANDGIHGKELWKSDGTATGTILVKDINPSYSGEAFNYLTPVGSTLFFVANDGIHGEELWESDGTATGTVLLKDIHAGVGDSWPDKLTVVGATLFFCAQNFENARELWKSDGTESGTVMVKDIWPGGTSSDPSGLTVLGSILLFSANDDTHGLELWKSDGTTSGTALVKDINPGWISSLISGLTRIGSTVYFSGYDSVRGSELWKTDGTTSGTELVKDLLPGEDSGEPRYLGTDGSTLFFSAQITKSRRGLWKSDGTSQGTVLIKDIKPDYDYFSIAHYITAGSALYFTTYASNEAFSYERGSEKELWRTDGSEAGTTSVTQICVKTGSSNPKPLGAVESCLFFTDDNYSGEGEGLWKTDGTPAGTVKIKDVNPILDDPIAMPLPFPRNARLGSTLLFAARDSSGDVELWKSDGTTSGTVRVKDINPGTGISMPGGMVTLGSTCFFSAKESGYGAELWKSDGTTSGTMMIKDIRPGSQSSSPQNLTPIGPGVFFTATDQTGAGGLWVTDGTEAGTHMVKKMFAGNLTAIGSTLFFADGDGVYGHKLWKSDGTAEGTVLVKDISACNLIAAGSTLFFTVQGGSTWELWKSDGTEAGTLAVKKEMPNYMENLAVVGSTLFFTTDYGTLWKSDGTEAGTVIVRNYDYDDGPVFSRALTAVGSELFFRASSRLHESELWKSDGTEAGTFIVKDINPGPYSAYPGSMVAVGSRLYFTADDGERGNELYCADGDGLTAPSQPGALNVGPNSLTWIWKDNSPPPNAEDGFKVYWGPGATAPLTVTLTTPANTTSRGVTDLLVNTPYAFQVAATGSAHGDTVKTANYTIYTAIEPISGVSVSAVSLDSITVTAENTPSNLTSGASGILLTNRTKGSSSSWVRGNSPWISSGLTPNTEYTLGGKSRNGSALETAEVTATTWTLIQPVAGLAFSNVTPTSIRVTPEGAFSNLGSGTSGIRIENKTALTATLWQTDSAPWNSTGLTPGTEYTFSSKSRNGAGVETAETTATAWTSAATPNAPAVSDPSAHSMTVAIGAGDGNPAHTQYAIYCATTRQYLTGDGAMSATAVWRTSAEWGTVTVGGLNLWRTYQFQTKARNGAGTETAFGAVASAMTFTAIPAEAKNWPCYE